MTRTASWSRVGYNLYNMKMHRVLAVLSLLCCSAQAAEYALVEGIDVIGEPRMITSRYEDTFVGLARTYDLGYEDLVIANPGVDPWLPGEGTQIVLPTQFVLPQAKREGIVVNLPELRLYYFPPGQPDRVITHPISIGRMDWSTPLGVTKVQAKALNPAWYPPQSIRDEHAADNRPLPAVVPPGPDNPLGAHALRLALPGYLIHGTNKPSGVGMRVTHGCIRMFPEDIEGLYKVVPVGTQVRMVNQPYKLGWGQAGLYLEAHPRLTEHQAEGASGVTELTRAFVAATEERYAEVDWESAETVMHDARGLPEFVSVPVASASN
jgi:L,D-transpeptidase ErfK/SrfK